MKISFSYKMLYILSFLYAFSAYRPAALDNIGIITLSTRAYYTMTFLISFSLYLWKCIKRQKLDAYDCVVFGLNFFGLICCIRNSQWLVNTAWFVIKIDTSIFIIKCTMTSNDIKVRDAFICGVGDCLFTLSFISIFYVIIGVMRNEIVDGAIVFWDYDNKCIGKYIMTMFYLYIKKYCINKKDYFFYIEIVIYALHTILLKTKTGQVIGIVLIGYWLLYHIKINKNSILLRIDKILVCIIFAIFLAMSGILNPIFVEIFPDKYGNLISRTRLWNYFWNMTLESPIYGNGVWSYKNMDLTNLIGEEAWKVAGNSHNMYIECLYKFGIPVFVLTFVLFVLAAKRNRLQSKHIRYLSCLTIAYMIAGSTELGYTLLFMFIPMIYFSAKLGEMENVNICLELKI